jgi:hypothetical protein
VRGFGNKYWGDNVPCDVPAPRDVQVDLRCNNGHKWTVIMDYEMGNYFFYDEDLDPYCPTCGERALE